MKEVLVIIGLWIGGIVCVLNFYLSFLRYPLFIFRGGKKEDYHFSSGLPLFGSLLVLVLLNLGHFQSWVWVMGVVLALLDTGGLHWFLGTITYHALSDKKV